MKTSIIILSAALTISAHAYADATAQGQAAATGSGSISADRNGASATGSAASAANASTKHADVTAAGSSEMSATLSKPVDARKAKPGDPVTATADKDSKTADGASIKKGSKLFGHVTQAKPLDKSASAGGNAESMLSIVFDKAVLKDGSEVPLNATIQAVSAAESAGSFDSGMGDAGMSTMGAGGGSVRSAGGLVGGVGGAVGGRLNAAGGVAGRVTQAGGSVGGMVDAGARSTGALGGISSAGALTSGSKGVFGMKGLEIASSSMGSAEGSVISSSTRSVRLDGGTKMLLTSSVTGGKSGEAATSAPTKPNHEPGSSK